MVSGFVTFVKKTLLQRRSLRRLILNEKLRKILPKVQGGIALDVGGAGGRYRDLIICDKYYTVDIQPSFRPTIVADAHAIPIANERFDLILLTEVLEHCYAPQKAVNEIHRILKRGGFLILSVPLIHELHASPNDYYRFTDSALEYLLRDFSKVTIEPLGDRFVAAYDLIIGKLPIIWIFNPLICRFTRRPASDCPSGFLAIARK